VIPYETRRRSKQVQLPSHTYGPDFRLSGRFHAWVESADAGETQWTDHRSKMGGVASWSLVLILVVGGAISQTHHGVASESWVLLTAANAIALALAIAALRRSQLPPILYSGIMAVFLLGGVLQLYLLSRNLPASSDFMREQAPLLNWVRATDIDQAYELITLTFVTFCIAVAGLAAIPIRPRFPRTSSLSKVKRFTVMLAWASIGYVAFTLLQATLGFGQASLHNRQLPLHIVAITLFYRRNIYPAILLLGVWVFDRHDRRRSYLCVIAIGLVAGTEAFVSTSRGTLIADGLPVLFLWLLTGRLTKFRKLLVVAGIGVYLILAPVLSGLRISRVRAATQSFSTPTQLTKMSPFSTASLNRQVGHILLRVGGTFSILFALHREDRLSVGGLEKVYRPSGLTSYFTNDVMGVPSSVTVAQSQAPTVIGMGTLVGGPIGAVLVLILSLTGLDLLWHWIPRRLWSWPVALSLLAQGGLIFFSEGVTIQLYKVFLGIATVEILYRFTAGRGGRALHEGVVPGASRECR
jgi:hypothetical protein